MNQEGQEDRDYWFAKYNSECECETCLWDSDDEEYEGCDCELCDGPQVWDDEEDED